MPEPRSLSVTIRPASWEYGPGWVTVRFHNEAAQLVETVTIQPGNTNGNTACRAWNRWRRDDPVAARAWATSWPEWPGWEGVA
jgi:hypothetical protein